MESKVVLVTGALSGIGRATALAFAATGAKIVVSGRREALGPALVEELKTAGAADAVFVRADAQSEDDWRSLVEVIKARFGRFDVAVNNAGIEGAFSSIDEISVDTYRS